MIWKSVSRFARRLDGFRSRHLYPFLVGGIEGMEMGEGVIVRGMPVVEITSGASVSIGRGVVLNSINSLYHVNMFAPVKLFAEGREARITIGAAGRIHGTCIHALREVSIGERCLVAANTQIFDSSGHDLSFPEVEKRIHTSGEARPVRIEDDVWIGTGTIILPGVRIGRGSVVRAGSVVVADIPPLCLAGGNPAVVLKNFESPGSGAEEQPG